MTIASLVADAVASMSALDRGPHLRGLLAALQAQAAADTPPPDRVQAVADRLLRGQPVAPGVERLDGVRALVAAIEAHLVDMRREEVAAVGLHLSAEAARLYKAALDRLGAEAARLAGRVRPEVEPIERRRQVAVCLVLAEPDPSPEASAWDRVRDTAAQRYGLDAVEAAKVTFQPPDVREIVNAVVLLGPGPSTPNRNILGI